MIVGSFYAGLSGLRSNSKALGVIGENLANVGTTGFKSQMINFSEIVSKNSGRQNRAGNPMATGLGSHTTEVISEFSQGALQETGIHTQAAIDGNGFFVVRDSGQTFFTRAGNFALNNEGYLVTHAGGLVQGYPTDMTGQTLFSQGVDDIRVPFGETSQPNATQLVRALGNLQADAVAGDEFQTGMEVFDSLGISHNLSITYTKTANPGEWSYQFDLPTGTVSTTFPTQGSGTITFDAYGQLSLLDGLSIQDPAAANRTIEVTGLNSGAADLTLTWDLIDFSTVPRGSFISGMGTTSSNGTLYQDGFGVGVLQDVLLQQDGRVVGYFSNGVSRSLAQLTLATFNNNHGLKRFNDNYYMNSAASGPATLDLAGSGGRGVIIGSSLENSNVDMSEEFTKMIIHQRGYQSNSKIITTADTLMQETLGLKRS